jgi:hypothetical protein
MRELLLLTPHTSALRISPQASSPLRLSKEATDDVC